MDRGGGGGSKSTAKFGKQTYSEGYDITAYNSEFLSRFRKISQELLVTIVTARFSSCTR